MDENSDVADVFRALLDEAKAAERAIFNLVMDVLRGADGLWSAGTDTKTLQQRTRRVRGVCSYKVQNEIEDAISDYQLGDFLDVAIL